MSLLSDLETFNESVGDLLLSLKAIRKAALTAESYLARYRVSIGIDHHSVFDKLSRDLQTPEVEKSLLEESKDPQKWASSWEIANSFSESFFDSVDLLSHITQGSPPLFSELKRFHHLFTIASGGVFQFNRNYFTSAHDAIVIVAKGVYAEVSNRVQRLPEGPSAEEMCTNPNWQSDWERFLAHKHFSIISELNETCLPHEVYSYATHLPPHSRGYVFEPNLKRSRVWSSIRSEFEKAVYLLETNRGYWINQFPELDCDSRNISTPMMDQDAHTYANAEKIISSGITVPDDVLELCNNLLVERVKPESERRSILKYAGTSARNILRKIRN